MPKPNPILLSTCAAMAIAIGAEASAQFVEGDPVACQNYDGVTRYLNQSGDATSSDLVQSDVPFVFEERLPEALPLLVGFGLSEPTSIRMTSVAVEGGDPVLSIRNAAGQMVAHNDDSASDYNSLIETDLEAGNYCAVLAAYGVDDLLVRAELSTLDQSATSETSTPIIDVNLASDSACFNGADVVDLGRLAGEGESLRGSTSVQTAPNLSFHLDQPGSVRITAENQSADPVLSVYAPSGELLDENDDFDGLNSQLIMTDLAAGEWCLQLDALSDDSLAILVEVTAVSDEEIARQIYARAERPPFDEGSYPSTDLGVLQTTLRATAPVSDGAWWGRFTIDEESLVEIDAPESSGLDPVLVLFDERGNMVLRNDDYGDSYGSRIYANLTSGEYWVAAHLFDHQSGGAQASLTVSFTRYVRAE